MNKVGYGFLAVALIFCAPGYAKTPVQAAYEARDIAALEVLAKNAATTEERNLAHGAALALRRKDEAAIATLAPIGRTGADKDIRATALQAIAEVYLRQGRFADTAAALKRAQALSTTPLDSDTLQTLDFVDTAAGEKPMRVLHVASGRLDVTRDMAGMIRVPVKINGGSQDAVMDSGAGFSTISESAAKRLGVRMLHRATNVRSASKDAISTRIGVADNLEFGETKLANVAFIVLPDAALTFAGGRYKIDAIMGLPVFIGLERIEVVKEGGKESLYYGPKPGSKGEPNLLLEGVEPLALVKVLNAATPLHMFIDTGAKESELNPNFVKDFPALAKAAIRHSNHFEGAGGQKVDQDAMNVPELKLFIAGHAVTLKNISMSSTAVAGRHGILGEDALRQGRGFVLDFEAMRLSLED